MNKYNRISPDGIIQTEGNQHAGAHAEIIRTLNPPSG